jgi:hypothetical protein
VDERADSEKRAGPRTIVTSTKFRHKPNWLTRHALYEDRGRNYWDITKGIEREQIGVAGDDQIRMTVHGQFEKFIVCRIATRDDSLGDGHRFCGCQQDLQPGMRGRSDQRSEIGPGENVEKLPLGCYGP